MANARQTQRVKAAVVGVGRMGSHHARTYSRLPQAELVGVVDADEERAETVADAYGCRAYTASESLLADHPDLKAVSVAVPTQKHLPTASVFLSRGVACLVEKPLAPTVAEAKELADLAASHRALLQVGHTERFNPAIRAVVKVGLVPRFISVERISPMTFRSLDVGVVMDMMIHDLDIVLMLARSKLSRVEAAGVSVLSSCEDVANARLVFENGCVANLNASRLALKTERKMRILSEKAYVSLDYQKRSGTLIRSSPRNVQKLKEIRAQLAAGEDLSEVDYATLVEVEDLTMDAEQAPGMDDPLTAELASFLEAATGGGRAEVDGWAGYEAVDAAERVVQAVRSHRWEGLEHPAVV